jgi:hypothetical protein
MNLILVRLGYPPAIIYKRDRSRYLAALARADQGDYGPLGEMIARAILDNLMRFVLPAIAGPARLVPLEALAGPDLSVIALRSADDCGRSARQPAPGEAAGNGSTPIVPIATLDSELLAQVRMMASTPNRLSLVLVDGNASRG